MSDNSVDTTGAVYAPLVSGSVSRHLRRQAIPMGYGILSVFGFSLADTFFIAKLGTSELAAITFTVPVMSLIQGLVFGLGIGVASTVSRGLGGGNFARVQRLTTDSLILGMIVVSVLVVAGFLSMSPLFLLIGANETTLPLVREYMEIWYLGAFFFVVPMFGISAIRAAGDTRTASRILILAGLTNLVLDPMFIFGFGPIPRMEMQGAAIATVLSEIVTLFAAYRALKYKGLITLRLPKWREALASWGTVLHVGAPAAATELVFPIVFGFITAFLASFGDEAVAGFGVASRIEMVALIPLIALNSVIGPFTGQNFGAGRIDRVREGVRKGVIFTTTYGFASAIFLAATSGYLPGLFDSNPEVVRVARMYLLIVPICYAAIGAMFVMIASFNALGFPRPSLVINMTRMVFLYLPITYVLMQWLGVVGIFLASPVVSTVGVLAATVWYFHIIRKLEAQQEEPTSSLEIDSALAFSNDGEA